MTASLMVALLALSGVAEAEGYKCLGKKATIVGTAKSDTIRGTNHRAVEDTDEVENDSGDQPAVDDNGGDSGGHGSND